MSSQAPDVSREMLQFLCTLYELQHLGQTASRLSISVPKASRLLSQGRKIFHDPLFYRHGYGLTPSEKMPIIVEHAQKALTEIRLLFDTPVFDPSKLTRVIRFICLDNAFPIMLEPLMPAFTKQAPNAAIALTTYDEQTFTRMRVGEVDFGLFPPYGLPSDFDSLHLIKTPYVNVVRENHPLTKLLDGNSKLLDQYINHYRRIQLIVHPNRDQANNGIPSPAAIPSRADNVLCWTTSWLGAVRMMHQTDAILTIPWRTAKVLAHDRPMVVLGREDHLPYLDTALVWHCRLSNDPVLQWLRSLFAVYVRVNSKVIPDQPELGKIS